MTYQTLIALDPYDRNTMHVYTRSVYEVGQSSLSHDAALQVDDLHAYWGEAGRLIQKALAVDEDAFTRLTPIVLTCEVKLPRAEGIEDRVSWEGVR